MTARERLRADLARYYEYEGSCRTFRARMKVVLGTEAIWSIVLYRFGQWLQEEAPRFLRALLRPAYQVVLRALRWLVGIHLYPSTRIGPGLYIGHFGGIWISPFCTLGSHCNISHEVTIGVAGRGRLDAPVLGDRVWVGPNATISGGVRVGSGAVIAANSLVVADVPENAVMIGVPARVMSYSGSDQLLEPRAGTPGQPHTRAG